MASRLLIRGGVLALQGRPQRGDVLCEGSRIVAIGRDIAAAEAEVLDATGLTLGPGFVDIHVHGGGGFSFFTKEVAQVRSYARWAPRNGVTSFLVSTLGRDDQETEVLLARLAPAIGEPGGAEALGFHLEGPFINPKRKGAFNEGMLRTPIQEEFGRYQQAAGGLIRQVTIAPELPWALDVIASVRHTGAVPAMGHTDATVEQARLGFETGVGHVTHLFNAMRPIHQREGGPIVAALMEDAVTCELICDGAHVAPELLQLAYRSLGPNRTVVVTDNLAIAGTHQDTGTFGGHEISTASGVAIRDDGVITGSVATMDQHFRNAVAFLNIEPATAFRLCSTNPARVAGANRRKGSLDRGMDADIVLLDGDLAVAATVCRGELVFQR
jgi:N-acetylglucosamine-6-phosphate deacetylase